MGILTHGLLKFRANGEEGLSVAKHHASCIGKRQTTSAPDQQRHAERLFEGLDLAADRLRRQVQTFAGSDHAPKFGHLIEIVEMLVVHEDRPLSQPGRAGKPSHFFE
ncbi:hypothetical protein D3C86_1463710 [compost metagenome]